MKHTLYEFDKRQDFLVCVDSDGCAIDTMDIKHKRCFGPCMVKEWQLESWKDEILTQWNNINLYTKTRGINRFKGLAMALAEINEKYLTIEGLRDLMQWTARSPELSNAALKSAPKFAQSVCLQKALAWSQAVNVAIDALPMAQKGAFPLVPEGLAAAHDFADVAVVSSANKDAVQEEWSHHDLLDKIDVLLAQDAGSKAHCIAHLKQKGYAPGHILMVGDAPGDLDAATQNDVFFYPILVREEAQSWQSLPHALQLLREGRYEEFGKQQEKAFWDNLSKKARKGE